MMSRSMHSRPISITCNMLRARLDTPPVTNKSYPHPACR
jgi:hypothetical protein